MTPSQEALRDLEAGILGGILIKPDVLGEMPVLEVDDFRDPRHRVVFAAMRNLEARAVPIDVVTLEAEIAKNLDGSGAVDFGFLGELCLRVPTAFNVFEYAKQVREAALSRRVRSALDGVLRKAEREELSGGEVLTEALAALSRIDAEQPDSTMNIDAIIKRRFKRLESIAAERASGVRTLTGYPTGIEVVDELTGGVQEGIVTIVAARPGMGKSSFGLALADATTAAGFGVHTFSLEDAEDPYADRTLSRSSMVPAESMRAARFNRGQMSDIAMAAAKLRGRPWLVDFRSGVTAEEVVRTVRRHRRENRTKVGILDYVTLLKRAPWMSRASGHEVVTENINVLADAAKHDAMAWVVMAQLNREIEKRQDRRPLMSDLRESGSLEERAKCILGLYRGAYYGAPVKGIDWHPDWPGRNYEPTPEEHAAQVQVLVMKNSNGPTGVRFARWNGPTTRME